MSLGGWRQATTLRTSPTMFPRRASAASSHLLFCTLTSWFHCAHPVAVNHLVVSTVWLGSAVRVSELCGLCWRDAQANGDGGQITVFGKGDQTRSIQLPASVWKNLEKWRGDAGDDQPLFPCSKRDGPLKQLAVFRIVRQVHQVNGRPAPPSPPPAVTSTLAPRTAREDFSHCEMVETARGDDPKEHGPCNVHHEVERAKLSSCGCLTVLGAVTRHHAVGLCRVETAANGDFQLGQNGLSTAGEIGTEPSTSFR